MQTISVATDFSTRSDRALRRAVLIAHQIGAEIVLIHALDNDLPASLLAIQRDATEALLADMANTITQVDRIPCAYRLVLGDPFRALLDAAAALDPAIVIMGPHRRNLLKDVFVGTTAERIIRQCGVPIVTANGVPGAFYQRVTIATDLSECAAHAVSVVASSGLLDGTEVTFLHVLDAPETAMMRRSFMSTQEVDEYEIAARVEALRSLRAFARDTPINPNRMSVEALEMSVADTIRAKLVKDGSDLLVIGTHGRSGLKRLLLGSVAEALLRAADIDVLAVPSGCH